MRKLKQERLAVVIVGGIYALAELIRPVWRIDWTDALTTYQPYWFWDRPASDHFETCHIDLMRTSIPVAGAIFAVIFFWWFLGVGRMGEAAQLDDAADDAPRRS
ncbi:MAG: hypothetical protein ACJAYX_003331 [Planctomycetota bacterium]|jgi:hypothetical protein